TSSRENANQTSKTSVVPDIIPIVYERPSAPPSALEECAYGGFILSVDGLLWTAEESGLSYASQTQQTNSLTAGTGKVKDLSFNWTYGFRVGAGFNIPHGNWDMYFNYTWYQNSANGNASNISGQSILPNFISAAANTTRSSGSSSFCVFYPATATSASAHWKLYLDVADWELGKQFVPSKWFSFRPFIGARGAFVYQDYDITYNGFSSVSSSGKYAVNINNDYWGVGPRAGFNSQFWLGAGFSVYGNTALSLLYGRFNISHIETNQTSTSTQTIIDLNDYYFGGRPVADMQFGLRWDSNVCKSKKATNCKCASVKKKANFSIAAGWEQHVFFSQGEFMHFFDATNSAHFNREHNDLSLQGGTISARLDF
ncbi:MAG: hypothetical protein EBZ47_04230, partial [Chlamydiae bacterium]|nr:hypothetical protein [Chlamydiota bacterium]